MKGQLPLPQFRSCAQVSVGLVYVQAVYLQINVTQHDSSSNANDQVEYEHEFVVSFCYEFLVPSVPVFVATIADVRQHNAVV